MYFVQKEGVYIHGIWWIGDDKGEGIKETRHLAAIDNDDCHRWCLYEFIDQEYRLLENRQLHKQSDPIHYLIFRAVKGDVE